MPVGKFHGVGAGHRAQDEPARHLHRRRSEAAVIAFLQQHFGKAGPWYHAIATGEDDRPVIPDRPRKSSGSETTFSNDLTDPADIEAGVQAMADEVWAWCEKARAFGRTVTVKIKYADFQQATRSRTLPAIVASQDALRDVSIALVRTVFPPAKGIRLVGATFRALRFPTAPPPSNSSWVWECLSARPCIRG